jgi:DUF4097 and DUF4098 domain-containing protein YvlB
MKRLIIVAVLIIIAAIAGIVRSHGGGIVRVNELSGAGQDGAEVREEIRKSFELAPGATVRVAGINGVVRIETADTTTAELYVERTAKSQESLSRRKISIDSSATNLEIKGKSENVGFIARLFGSSPHERVTLRLPRQVSLITGGVNGDLIVGEIDGSVEIHGINGKVDVGQASGSAEFHGINGNITVALKGLEQSGVRLKGINGNIEVRLAEGMNAELEARGMNGRVVSDLPDFVLEEEKHGSYSAHVGTGGSPISAHGINGNIRLSRVAVQAQAKNTL